MVKGGFIEQVRTEQRLKGGEGIDHADTCRQKKNQHHKPIPVMLEVRRLV